MDIEITYCGECRYWGQALDDARMLLDTAEGSVDALTLNQGSGGVYEIAVDGDTVFSKAEEGGFPEEAQLKDLIDSNSS